MATDMTLFTAAGVIPFLRELGKHDWLVLSEQQRPLHRLSSLDSETSEIVVDYRIPESLEPLWRELNSKFYLPFNQHPILLAVSKAIAFGPKVLCPTPLQCEALEHIEIHVPFADYQQPFPTIIIELPSAYCRAQVERWGVPCPTHILLHHDPRSGVILVEATSGQEQPGSINVMVPRYHADIEAALLKRADIPGNEPGPDLDLSRLLYRVAINFGLLLTHYGTVDLGPRDPAYHDHLVRNAARRNPRKAAKAQAKLNAEVHYISFAQDFIIYDTPATPGVLDEEPIAGETEVERAKRTQGTHWRRGHWRQQRHGPAFSLTKRILIKPVLIRADRFVGDLADTSYRAALRTS